MARTFTEQEIAAAAKWLPVTSSNVKAICWREPKAAVKKGSGLGIWFKGKPETTYWYPSAPFTVYQKMKGVGSKGRFVHEIVKPQFAAAGPYPGGG